MSIKILHTSDWHLGKKLYKKDRIQEQELFLDWLFQYIKKEHIDILLIAGDIFDVPTPPNSAVTLYYNFLEKVSTLGHTELVIISGNHDSGHFLKAPSSILSRLNIHIYTNFPLSNEDNLFEFTKDKRKVEVKSIPYFRSYDLNQCFSQKLTELDKDDYLALLEERSNSWKNQDSFKIILSHHAFGSFMSSESEHTLSLAGLESIPATLIGKTADYVALGHIHKPQSISSSKNIVYSGSPIPLRFSEVESKSMQLIELSEQINISPIQVPEFRKLIRIKGSEKEVLKQLKQIEKNIENLELNTWLELQVRLPNPKPELLDSIKDLLEGSQVELISYHPSYSSLEEEQQEESINFLESSIYDMFEHYYKLKYPESESIPAELKEAFSQLIQESANEN